MYQRIFSSYIAIVALKSKGKLEQKTPMGEAEGKAFVDGVFHLLEELAAKPLGLALLDDIERAMKPVIIYRDTLSRHHGERDGPVRQDSPNSRYRNHCREEARPKLSPAIDKELRRAVS